MNAEIIRDIRYSWEYMSENGPQKMLVFYDKLFNKAPEARKLFPKDLSRQSEKLAYTVGFVVANIDRIESIKESIEDLGRIHNKLNIDPAYYVPVTETLVETIKEQMGDKYKPGIGESWMTALTTLSEIMINAPKHKRGSFRSLVDKLLGRS